MNKDVSEFQEYIKTVGWTLFVAIIVVFIMVIDLKINAGNKKLPLERSGITEYKDARMGLDRLYYLEKENPKDYIINLKIAFLHEILKENDKAQENYEKALIKSNSAPFALYKAAVFYAKQHDTQRAINLAIMFPATKEKRTYEMKARFFAELANTFLTEKDYPNAIKTYKVSYKYARNTDDTLENKIAKEYSNAYSEYADDFISKNDPIHGLQMLKNALEVYPDPYSKYKLGLMYQNVDDVKAQKYIEEVYSEKPEIVNIELYNKLLNKLVNDFNQNGEFSKANFYRLKLDNFKRKLVSNNIYKNDLEVLNLNINKQRRFIFTKEKYNITFDLKNNSKYSVENLFVKIVIKPRGENNTEAEKKVIYRDNPLLPGKTLKGISIPIEYGGNLLGQYGEMQILAKKNVLSNWTIIDYLTVSFTK